MSDVGAGKTLLIVEDERDLREPLVLEFESLGYQVLQAGNGVEGYKIVETQKVDVVISDIRMPGGDGVELLKKIKARDYAVPVVMLITGYSDLSHADAYHLGAEAMLSKPFDLDEIGAAVAGILTPRRERWAAAVKSGEAKQQFVASYETLAAAVQLGELGLGRGGIYLRRLERQPGVGNCIAFRVRFESGEILVLEGNGRVRWSRAAEGASPEGIGVEFESLDEVSREAVIALTDAMETRPYIPNRPFLGS